MRPSELRILLLSTPKTGNTWLRNLLSAAYRLPQLTLATWPFDADVLDREGDRWITHHHYLPTPEIIEWIQKNRIVVITTIRHPADVLVSLYYHIHKFQPEPINLDFLRHMLLADFERTGVIPAPVGEAFSYDLECSIAWMKTGLSHIIRYEDLRRQTEPVLTGLTGKISPLSAGRVEAAIEACNLELMRGLAGGFGGFFRIGSVGCWSKSLPNDIVDLLRNREPYRTQLSILGYTMDHPVTEDQPRDRSCPLQHLEAFDNGVRIPPILVKCFLHADGDLRQRWSRDLGATGPESFFAWLNAPAEPSEATDADRQISNLAQFLYFDRHDVRTAFPDIQSLDRREFVEWFHTYPGPEYGLDAVFFQRKAGDLTGHAFGADGLGHHHHA